MTVLSYHSRTGLLIILLALTACQKAALGPEANALARKGRAGKVPYCEDRAFALPIERPCPRESRIGHGLLGSYRNTARINSPAYGYAHVRADTYFKAGYAKNILGRLAHGRPFCSRRRASYLWEIVLKDPRGNLCRGYIASKLVKCATPKKTPQSIRCVKPAYAFLIRGRCPIKSRITKSLPPLGLFKVHSPRECYANIRSSGDFSGERTNNVLGRAAQGQPICGRGLFKYVDPRTGERGAIYYKVVLRDNQGRRCWGYVHRPLLRPINR